MTRTEALSEFDIITRYFRRAGLAADPALHSSIPLSIGDDCALIRVPENRLLAVSMDILNEGVHFPAKAPAHRVATRALAVNLSDLAAMGADVLGFTLGLSLPDADSTWLESFSEGLLASAQRYDCPLMGGDITRGPLAITIQIHGLVHPGRALTRDGARAGDMVMVTGTLGDAACALEFIQGRLAPAGLTAGEEAQLLDAYYCPEPRLAWGQWLVAPENEALGAGIDISDGLLADLQHIAEASGVAIHIREQALPVTELNIRLLGREHAMRAALSGGDDYELAFTVAPERREALMAAARSMDLRISEIGQVVEGAGLCCLDEEGRPLALESTGYRHFQG